MTNIALYSNAHVPTIIIGLLFATLLIFTKMLLWAYCEEEKRTMNEDDLLLREFESAHRDRVYGAE